MKEREEKMAERGQTVAIARKIKTCYGFPKKHPSRRRQRRLDCVFCVITIEGSMNELIRLSSYDVHKAPKDSLE
nr:hypothetical protein [Tanacetum cinerariifolium]